MSEAVDKPSIVYYARRRDLRWIVIQGRLLLPPNMQRVFNRAKIVVSCVTAVGVKIKLGSTPPSTKRVFICPSFCPAI